MLIELTFADGRPCWLNPAEVAFVGPEQDPIIYLVSDRMIRLRGEAADIARRINTACSAPPAASGSVPLPWISETACKWCGRRYGRQYSIVCGAMPRCPHCGKIQGGAWEQGPGSHACSG